VTSDLSGYVRTGMATRRGRLGCFTGVVWESGDPEFKAGALAERVAWGAAGNDPVRLHGAITAALNLYPRWYACSRVFAPALDRLDGEAWERAADAFRAHLVAARTRRGGHVALRR